VCISDHVGWCLVASAWCLMVPGDCAFCCRLREGRPESWKTMLTGCKAAEGMPPVTSGAFGQGWNGSACRLGSKNNTTAFARDFMVVLSPCMQLSRQTACCSTPMALSRRHAPVSGAQTSAAASLLVVLVQAAEYVSLVSRGSESPASLHPSDACILLVLVS
jgi:hypothetical protein